jgi:hypothetical protein
MLVVLQPDSAQWRSRHLVVTPELLGLHTVGDCRQRVLELGLTPLPWLAYRQEFWRLDVLLRWSKRNGFEQLPTLGRGTFHRR